ncbi:MAG: cardiolipin synthase [Tannerella sp.]|jgi:cardiolipin synthase|nr:cardiolipin synthase [Tannerella sp.]
MGISTLISTIFVVLYSLTITGLVLLILLENRNPLKTIPWILVLIFVPGIGLIVYYFFGRDNRRLRIISRRIYKQFFSKIQTNNTIHNINEIPENYRPLANLLNNNSYSAIFTGSKISVFTNGKEKFDSLIQDIANAKHYVNLQYFIFNDDKTGLRIKEALIAKAHEGVKIRVLYDDVANWNVKSKFYDEMKKEGIEIYSFLKVAFPWLTSKVNYRNHRKNVVIDGKTGYMGGMNIADRYVTGNKLGEWRDTHFKIEGPGVYGLQAAFMSDWYAVTRKEIKNAEYYHENKIYTDLKIQIVMSGPTDPWRTLLQAFNFCISNAKKYIYIQTPYFLPTEGLNQALQMAALSGIDVKLMLTEKSDTIAAQMAMLSYMDKMLRSGVKIYLYNNGFLHSKLLISDEMITCFGSSNFDFRSFEHNFEINAFVYQHEFALRMKNLFMHDLVTGCKELNLKLWRKRPFTRRLAESFMRLFSPLL